jgi:hypothetical protein
MVKKFMKKITKRQPKKLPGEMSMEELDASVKEICNKFFAQDDVRKKALADAGKPFFLPPDELRKGVDAADIKRKESTKTAKPSDFNHTLLKELDPRRRAKRNKGVPRLGETSRPISPLLVANEYGSNVEYMNFNIPPG